jgi:hypothetical protein
MIAVLISCSLFPNAGAPLADAKKAESGKVYINMPTSSGATKSSTPAKVAKNVTDKTIMRGANGQGPGHPIVFRNENDEVILENNEWTETYSMREMSMSTNYIENIGIVKIGDPNFYCKDNTYHFDIVNSKGQYFFNDNTIKSINYINDGWLLIGNFDSDNYFLYNLNTKNKIILENSATGTYRDRHALDLFAPIFSASIQLNSGGPQHQAATSEGVKKSMLQWASSNISEEILSKYSFALVHTNYGKASTFAGGGRHYSGFDDGNVVLYCVSEDGELTKINLN